MDFNKFDNIARLFAARRTRRATLQGAGLGLAAAAVAPFAVGSVAAQDGTPAADDQIYPADPHPSADAPTKTEFLFVQPFAGGTWAPKEGEEGVFTLTLTGAAAQTVYFSDRPERIFGLMPTGQLLDTLGFTPANPPNAALVTQGSDGAEEVLIVELLNPVFDEAAGTLTYDAKIQVDYSGSGLAHAARSQTDYTLPETFAAGGLFIDDCEDHILSCYHGDTKVGEVNVGYCFNASRGCIPCHDPRRICGDHYGACLNKPGCLIDPGYCEYTCDVKDESDAFVCWADTGFIGGLFFCG